jgi:hypothetical protein
MDPFRPRVLLLALLFVALLHSGFDLRPVAAEVDPSDTTALAAAYGSVPRDPPDPSDHGPDPNDNWWDGFILPSFRGANGLVRAVLFYDGDIVIGGNFEQVDEVDVNRVSRFDGESWKPLGAGLDGAVHSLGVFSGDLVAGGEFTMSGDHAARRVARWTGDAWEELAGGTDDNVNAMTTLDGDLVIGGRFLEAGGTPVNRVARWNGSDWLPLGEGLSDEVLDLEVFGGDLIAAGRFDEAGGTVASRIARWNGAAWLDLGGGADREVHALTVHGAELIAGGEFSIIGGQEAARIASWDGSSWSSLGPGFTYAQAVVYSLSSTAGSLIAGGVELVNDPWPPHCPVVRWQDSTWIPLGSDLRPNDARVHAIGAEGSSIVIGGALHTPGGRPVYNVVRLSEEEEWKTIWDRARGLNRGALFNTYEGELLAAGSFTKAGDNDFRYAALWNGADWEAFPVTLDDHVEAVAYHDDQLILGGRFSVANGESANRIVAWDGETVLPLGEGITGFTVRALATYEGRLVAGGLFGAADGVPCQNIAQWNGASWSPLGDGLDGTVNALAVFEGELYAGGYFDSSGVVDLNRIGRWNGSEWGSVGSGAHDHPNFGAWVNALLVYSNKLMAAGHFLLMGGVYSGGIASWDGVSWKSLGTSFNPPDAGALAVSNGSLVVGGNFDLVDFQPVNNLALWTGGQWFGFGSGLNSYVTGVREFGDRLYVAGDFTEAGSIPSFHIARWESIDWSLLATDIPGFEREARIEETTDILSVSPNPVSTEASIRFRVDRSGPVRITVYDVGGRRVGRVLDAVRDAGVHTVRWSRFRHGGSAVAAGVYFLRLEAGGEEHERRVVVSH